MMTRCFFTTANLHYVAFVALISGLICNSQPLQSAKDHNEIYFTLRQVNADVSPHIKLVEHSLNENEAVFIESEGKVTTDNSDVDQDYDSTNSYDTQYLEKIISTGINTNNNATTTATTTSTTTTNNNNNKVYPEDEDKIRVEDGGTTSIKEEEIARDTNKDSSDRFPLSGTSVVERPVQGDSADDQIDDDLRFKKQVKGVKYSEPRPFKYKFHDPLTGAYRFGYGTRDQYRTEERVVNGTVSGRFGWRDSEGEWHETNFVADELGYRITPPNDQLGPPLFIRPPPSSSPSLDEVGSIRKNRYQHINPHEYQENKEQQVNKRRLDPINSDGESLDQFHSIKFPGPNRKGDWNDAWQSSQRRVEDGSNLFGENKFRYPFTPSTKNTVVSHSASPQEESKVTKQDTITMTNLQDNFFDGLPLMPQNFKPKDYAVLTRRRAWPAIIEKASKPFWFRRINTEGRGVRANRIEGREQQEESIQSDQAKRTKTVRSTPVNSRQNNLEHFNKMAKNSAEQSHYNQFYRSPIGTFIQNKEPHHNILQTYGYDFPPQTENLDLISLLNSLGYLRPYSRPTMFPFTQTHYMPNNFLPPPAYTNTFYPLPQMAINNYYANPWASFNGLPSLPVTAILIISAYNSHLIAPTNYLNERNKYFTHQYLPNDLMNYPDTEVPEDNVDYLLLSDEFQEVNGSIMNDPAFGNIKELQLQKAQSDSATFPSQNNPTVAQSSQDGHIPSIDTAKEEFQILSVSPLNETQNKVKMKPIVSILGSPLLL